MKKDRTVAEKSIVCAYCKGKGRDPFGLLSPCNGLGVIGKVWSRRHTAGT